jgi:hypothetical protein
LVPVLARPHRAQPLADSLRSTSDCRLLFICSPNDVEQIAACHATKEMTIVSDWQPGRADFARKTDLGFDYTDEDWIFCGADDLEFHSGWLEEAIRVGERHNAGVVGTQDTANPSVKRGIHSTHPLVRRSYIEEHGGTFDGTGKIYSHAYDHQFVDNDLCEVAKARGQWAFAKRSVVKHLHPAWGTAPTDSTYEKAVRATSADRALFVQRMRRFNQTQARRARV